ncbi:MAG: ClpXP protease specificity-enhancing factor SspB [Pseudolabrys sp.]
MAVDHIRYDILAQEALRGVVQKVLVDVAKNGLPGEHHFYISFDTRAEGVRLSPRMLAQYPEEITVVLQHQFWDLVVTEEGFEVGMSFGGIPERLNVPFAAVKGFFDPSVQFCLQFEEIGDAAAAGEDANAPARKDRGAARPPAEHKGVTPSMAAVPAPANAVPAPANPDPAKASADDTDKPSGGGEVVRLDRFRKK